MPLSRHSDPRLDGGVLSLGTGIVETPSWHSDLELNLLVEGAVSYLHAGRVKELQVGRLTAFWAGSPHRVESSEPGTTLLWLTLPFAWAVPWALPGRLSDRLLAGAFVQEDQQSESCVEDELMLRRWIAMAQDERVARATLLLELEARLRRLGANGSHLTAGSTTPGSRAVGTSRSGQAVAFAATYLSSNFRDRLRTDELARKVGMHPVYLAQLFREVCGTGMHSYVQHLRLSHAQGLLITTDMSVLNIGLESGFGSASQFYACFRRYSGTTPNRYRQDMALAGRAAPPQGAPVHRGGTATI